MDVFKVSFIVIFLWSFTNGLPNQFYSVTRDGVIHPKDIDNGNIYDSDIAWTIYENNINNRTGWASLELFTNSAASEKDQAYFSGYLEGYVTGHLIANHWRNVYGTYCSEDRDFCNKLRDFIRKNQDFINRKVQENGNTDDYWHQIDLIYQQIRGIQNGYNYHEKVNNYKLPQDTDPVDILIMNLLPEIDTIKKIYNKKNSDASDYGRNSAIVKPFADGSDLLVGHNTWSNYNTMLRIVKKYHFEFKRYSDNYRIPGQASSFTSYPGLIYSKDDFYIISSGLVVIQTSLTNTNKSLWRRIYPESIVFEFIRNVVANRLAFTGREWTQIFSKHNSGTYNNQFMIIDYKRFSTGTNTQNLSDGLLWIIEQMPGIVRSEDVTYFIRRRGYFASYNIPYFKEIADISGNNDLFNKYGAYYGYNFTARALTFNRDHKRVSDLKSMYKLMRYNNFKNDGNSKCRTYQKVCAPPFNAHLAIAARNDLNDPNGQYPINEWVYRGYGAIDAKITNVNMVRSREMLVINGPTYEQHIPFQWSRTSLSGNHYGHPDLFNFSPYYVKWYPNNWQEAVGFARNPNA